MSKLNSLVEGIAIGQQVAVLPPAFALLARAPEERVEVELPLLDLAYRRKHDGDGPPQLLDSNHANRVEVCEVDRFVV